MSALIKMSFGGALGEKGTAQSIQTLMSEHGGNIVLFSAIKDQKPPNEGSATAALVWRKYRMLGGDILHDIPKHVLITSAAVTKGGTIRTRNFALVCNSSGSIEDRRACLQIFQPSLQKARQRRKTWKVGKRQTNYHSISQVDELPDLGSGVR